MRCNLYNSISGVVFIKLSFQVLKLTIESDYRVGFYLKGVDITCIYCRSDYFAVSEIWWSYIFKNFLILIYWLWLNVIWKLKTFQKHSLHLFLFFPNLNQPIVIKCDLETKSLSKTFAISFLFLPQKGYEIYYEITHRYFQLMLFHQSLFNFTVLICA